ncbi:uncharacterized protein LOC141638062 [Silene latifolia]|uniref:uncharacterized protein LOC141638062 n=1 Tax=Silene latifolia TaxID=37657 RepID=UPI003D77C014
MDKFTFDVLCGFIRSHGLLNESKNMFLEERVVIFLNILAHDQKQRMLVRRLKRSKETNCLGALDETHIMLKVPVHEKPKYRTRKGFIATNVLAACTKDMQFTYIVPGYEGSAADGRVLQDVVNRRHPFKVPRGYYYLVDAGFTNGEGFLAPYRGQRYHFNEWKDGRQPNNHMENNRFYSADTHTDIISTCALLHNLIRREMSFDPMEPLLDTEFGRQFMDNSQNYINIIDTSGSWTECL